MDRTARHLVNRAPRSWYSARRSRRPSRPSVTFSPVAPASGFAPLSTLMPGNDPARREKVGERRAVRAGLSDRLVEEDHTTDMCLHAGCREEHLAIRSSGLLRRLQADRPETLLDRRRRLVCGKDAFARCDERVCCRGRIDRSLSHGPSSSQCVLCPSRLQQAMSQLATRSSIALISRMNRRPPACECRWVTSEGRIGLMTTRPIAHMEQGAPATFVSRDRVRGCGNDCRASGSILKHDRKRSPFDRAQTCWD
jgi:hypothetical protein